MKIDYKEMNRSGKMQTEQNGVQEPEVVMQTPHLPKGVSADQPRDQASEEESSNTSSMLRTFLSYTPIGRMLPKSNAQSAPPVSKKNKTTVAFSVAEPDPTEVLDVATPFG